MLALPTMSPAEFVMWNVVKERSVDFFESLNVIIESPIPAARRGINCAGSFHFAVLRRRKVGSPGLRRAFCTRAHSPPRLTKYWLTFPAASS